MKKITSILTFTIIATFLCAQVSAQIGRTRRFDRPLTESAGDSFRQRNDELNKYPSSGRSDSAFNERVNLMTESSSANLLYQIHVLGEVNNPGTYRVMASERLAEVVQRAGGVEKQGSKRRIEIRRNGKTVRVIDLLQFKTFGKLKHNPYLLDNDVVFVPLKKRSVQIVGAVKRPETYEIVKEKNVQDMVELAGGFSTGVAKKEPVRLIRFVDGNKNIFELKYSDLEKTKIKNGDVIYIPNVVTAGHKFDYDIAELPGDNVFYPSFEDRVFVLGGVELPGAYAFNPYYNIQQYISLAGGYSKLATKKMKILTPEGKRIRYKEDKDLQINPGDTILIGERRIPPEGWVNLFMSVASFGLSTTATVLTLTK